MATPPAKQLLKDADARATNGEFLQAINLYEDALDGSEHSADIHYKIALLYDDKMNDPLNALHHFKRYLTLAPSGPRAEEVKNYMKKDELALLTTLSGDSVISREEATRLKKENLSLREQLDARRVEARNAAASQSAARATRVKKSSPSKKRPTKHNAQSQ
jgi:tetratricopeptide (TPR) repeat protein